MMWWSVYLSICLSVYLSICLSVYLSICLSVYLSICLYMCAYIYLSMYVYMCVYVCIWMYLSAYVCMYVSTYCICEYLQRFLPRKKIKPFYYSGELFVFMADKRMILTDVWSILYTPPTWDKVHAVCVCLRVCVKERARERECAFVREKYKECVYR
jgi:hypothetical protein